MKCSLSSPSTQRKPEMGVTNQSPPNLAGDAAEAAGGQSIRRCSPDSTRASPAVDSHPAGGPDTLATMPRAWSWILAAWLFRPTPVHADVLPPPSRPTDWNVPEPPAPEPPPEKAPLGPAFVGLAALLLVIGARQTMQPRVTRPCLPTT